MSFWSEVICKPCRVLWLTQNMCCLLKPGSGTTASSSSLKLTFCHNSNWCNVVAAQLGHPLLQCRTSGVTLTVSYFWIIACVHAHLGHTQWGGKGCTPPGTLFVWLNWIILFELSTIHYSFRRDAGKGIQRWTYRPEMSPAMEKGQAKVSWSCPTEPWGPDPLYSSCC